VDLFTTTLAIAVIFVPSKQVGSVPQCCETQPKERLVRQYVGGRSRRVALHDKFAQNVELAEY
jgi:hypothetical protein